MNPKTLKMILIISLLVFHYFLLVLTVSKGLLITKIAIIRLLLQLKDEALSTTPLLGILLNQIAILGNVDLTTKTLDENSSYQATANKNPLSRTHLQLSTRSLPIQISFKTFFDSSTTSSLLLRFRNSSSNSYHSQLCTSYYQQLQTSQHRLHGNRLPSTFKFCRPHKYVPLPVTKALPLNSSTSFFANQQKTTVLCNCNSQSSKSQENKENMASQGKNKYQ